MKKTCTFLTAAVVAALLTACTQQPVSDASGALAAVTFRVSGDFGNPTFSRADISTMSDLWLFDYDASGTLVQQLHQSAADADFGTPTLALTLGDHDLYFVAAAGADPVLSTAAHTVTWGTPRDVFWHHLSYTVTEALDTSLPVVLGRAATRLTATIADAIPDGIAAITFTPAVWYYGLDYLTGAATAADARPLRITLPASYAGRTAVKVGILGLAPADGFTTTVTLAALDADDTPVATATIADAPLVANRSTDYTGNLFTPAAADIPFAVTIDDTWDEPYEGRF